MHHGPAVDAPRLAGDVIARLGGEEQGEPPAAARQHVRDHGSAHQERALEVHVEHEIPRLFRYLPDQASIGAVGCRRVVDEHVDAAEPRERLGDEAFGIGGAAHVAHEREGAASQALDLRGQALEPLPALTDLFEPLLVLVPRPADRDIGRGDIRPRAGERDGQCAADPATRPHPVTSTLFPSNSFTVNPSHLGTSWAPTIRQSGRAGDRRSLGPRYRCFPLSCPPRVVVIGAESLTIREERREPMTKKASKKPAFGGYAISFRGPTDSLESLFGATPIGPAEMTKKLWSHVKRKGLATKP